MPEGIPDEAFDKAEVDFTIQQNKLAYSKLKRELDKALLFQTVASTFLSDKKMRQIHRITETIAVESKWRRWSN